MHRFLRGVICLLAPALIAWGCSSGGSGDPGTGTLRVEATDAPISPDLVESGTVWVSEILVHRNFEGESGFVQLYPTDEDDEPIELELTDLRNGLRQELVEADLPAGHYKQVRLVFDHAHLELTNGNVYTTEEGNLTLTSEATSGLKIHIDPPVYVPADGIATLCLDFDLSKTFRPIPASGNPLHAPEYKIGPVIRAVNVENTGEIRGVVDEDDGTGTGTLVPVEGAVVYILPLGETDTANSVAASITEADGSYAVICLLPGTYDVLAVKTSDGKEASAAGVPVVIGSVSVVDLTVE